MFIPIQSKYKWFQTGAKKREEGDSSFTGIFISVHVQVLSYEQDLLQTVHI